jgi:hypothetical protein
VVTVGPRARLAGDDGPGRRALPAGELLGAIPLVSVALLLINDWVLKPSAAAPWLSGKLSDVAGLVVAPVAATAAFDCVLWLVSRAGLAVDFSLGRGRLAIAVVACGAVFAAVKLLPAAAGALETAAAAVGLDWRIVADPTDLVALPALAVAAWLGRRELASVPLGRLEVLERRFRRSGRSPAEGLRDVAASGGDPAAVDDLAAALATWLQGGPSGPAQDALDRLRGRPGAARGPFRGAPD